MRYFALLFLLLTPVVWSQSGQRRFDPIPAADQQSFTRQARVAVLIGVGKYPRGSGLTELRYPARDVDLLAAEMEKQGYTVVTLKESDATRTVVRRTLRNLGEVVDRNQGTLVFYFSGHGFAVSGKNYLATFDAGADELNTSGLALEEVQAELRKTGAPRQVLWIDACRNESGRNVSPRTFDRFQQADGTRVLFAARNGRVSYENDELQQGVFSYFLRKGLRGEAAGADGWITFQDLRDYVSQEVRAYSLKRGEVQVPYEAGESSGDFLLARASRVTEVKPPAAPAGPRPLEIRENPRDGQRYVYIPPGEFLMGCSAGDTECDDDEAKPAKRTVIGRGFYLKETEVTQGEYERLTGKNPSHFKGEKRPVETVSWNDADGYCRGLGLRLPSAAEWEYAARAGTTGARYGDVGEIAWFDGNSGNTTHEVKGKKANAWGLYDMLGNVYEWTSTDYSTTAKELRGGSWYVNPRDVRASFRFRFVPTLRSYGFGFRCAGDIP